MLVFWALALVIVEPSTSRDIIPSPPNYGVCGISHWYSPSFFQLLKLLQGGHVVSSALLASLTVEGLAPGPPRTSS